MRFVIGLVCGLLILGSYVGYQQLEKREDPCLGHCGVGTECVEGVCMVPAKVAERPKKRRRRRGRRRRRRGRAVAGAEEPSLRQPTAADLQPVTRGPTLRQTDYVDLTKGEAAGGRELSTAEINARVRRLNVRIVACIDKARGDLDIASGKVTVGFRIERSGRVEKVRVTAPAALMQRGLHGCLAPLIASLRFGPTSRSLIMSYPYALN